MSMVPGLNRSAICGRAARDSVSALILAVLCLSWPAFGQALTPPPPPDVPPLIGQAYVNDADGDRIDDGFQSRVAGAARLALAATTPSEKQNAQAALGALVDVELIFNTPITQQQINDFLASGGQIDYIYKAVSYGWNGRLPLDKVTALPQSMGATLVLVNEPKRAVLHLDMATQTGRVRPVWAAGFAGNPSGFDGDANTTIAIIDTGVDGTHTDLSGRQQFWKDYTPDGYASPRDLIQHGSHVTGIALGTGAASGSATGTLYYTQEGDLTGVPGGSFYPATIGLPAASLSFTSIARWIGGGSTSLYLVYEAKGSGSWYAQSAATAGASPITEANTFTPSTANVYSPALLSNGAMGDFVVANTVTNYPAVGDGFNKLRGVAPGCQWAGAKVFTDAGSGLNTYVDAAIDELVSVRVANNIKVMNMSLGTIGDPGLDPTERQKVNTAVNNGIVMVISAGNDGKNTSPSSPIIDDPGRAAMALTVAANNNLNQLTDYTSIGFTSPGSTAGQEEDYKPDIMAPGGSLSYDKGILSVDSNTGDGPSFADQRANDYTVMQGTSMASPFAAGAAAVVIDALQQSGTTWSFASGQHSKYVKMVLCATANESNVNREGGANNPTLQRSAAGPSGFPAGKDPDEGYGLLNLDAAVEAVTLTYTPGNTQNDVLGSSTVDRRAWARKVNLTAGTAFAPTLTVPGTGDFDLYLYSGTPSNYGTPVILASSTTAASGGTETFNYTPVASGAALLVVKRVSGSGVFSVTSTGGPVTIAARKLFYNNSWYDNDNAGIDAVTTGQCDSNAIDNGATLYSVVYPAKAPLMSGGGTATFANYSGYTQGLNGLIYDVVNAGIPRDPQVGDFTFHNIGKAGTTTPAPANLVTPSGFGTIVISTSPRTVRAVITFTDNAVKETWLQVDVGTSFGATAETHFWGNAAGDTNTGNSGLNILVGPPDELAVRAHPTTALNRSVVADPFDVNKTSLCDPADQLFIRSAPRIALNCVKLIVK